MLTEIIVICAHCKKVLKRFENSDPKAFEDSISHSDCLGYQDRPCLYGQSYHMQVAKDLGFSNYAEYLDRFKKRSR